MIIPLSARHLSLITQACDVDDTNNVPDAHSREVEAGFFREAGLAASRPGGGLRGGNASGQASLECALARGLPPHGS